MKYIYLAAAVQGEKIIAKKNEKIGATGLEPVTTNPQPTINKEVTLKPKTATAQKLPKSGNSDIKGIAENDTDLKQIVTVWPNLPEHIKAAIKALIQANNEGV